MSRRDSRTDNDVFTGKIEKPYKLRQQPSLYKKQKQKWKNGHYFFIYWWNTYKPVSRFQSDDTNNDGTFEEENTLDNYQQKSNYLDKCSCLDWIVMWDVISGLQHLIISHLYVY